MRKGSCTCSAEGDALGRCIIVRGRGKNGVASVGTTRDTRQHV